MVVVIINAFKIVTNQQITAHTKPLQTSLSSTNPW